MNLFYIHASNGWTLRSLLTIQCRGLTSSLSLRCGTSSSSIPSSLLFTMRLSSWPLMGCIITLNLVNKSEIIVQEMQACSKKKDGMIYFPCLITTLRNRQGVPEGSTNEIYYPQVGFDKASIQTLLKPKGKNRLQEARQETT